MRLQVAKMSVRLPLLLEVLQEVEIRQSARCWLFVRRDAAGRRVTVEEARDEAGAQRVGGRVARDRVARAAEPAAEVGRAAQREVAPRIDDRVDARAVPHRRPDQHASAAIPQPDTPASLTLRGTCLPVLV